MGPTILILIQLLEHFLYNDLPLRLHVSVWGVLLGVIMVKPIHGLQFCYRQEPVQVKIVEAEQDREVGSAMYLQGDKRHDERT